MNHPNIPTNMHAVTKRLIRICLRIIAKGPIIITVTVIIPIVNHKLGLPKPGPGSASRLSLYSNPKTTPIIPHIGYGRITSRKTMLPNEIRVIMLSDLIADSLKKDTNVIARTHTNTHAIITPLAMPAINSFIP